MKNAQAFEIKNGEISMDAMPSVKEFIKGSADYMVDFILDFQKALGAKGPVTAVCQEDDLAFSLEIDREIEQQQCVSGAYVEGSNCGLNQLL